MVPIPHIIHVTGIKTEGKFIVVWYTIAFIRRVTSRHAIVIGDVLIQVGPSFLSVRTVLLESFTSIPGFLGSRDRSIE